MADGMEEFGILGLRGGDGEDVNQHESETLTETKSQPQNVNRNLEILLSKITDKLDSIVVVFNQRQEEIESTQVNARSADRTPSCLLYPTLPKFRKDLRNVKKIFDGEADWRVVQSLSEIAVQIIEQWKTEAGSLEIVDTIVYSEILVEICELISQKLQLCNSSALALGSVNADDGLIFTRLTLALIQFAGTKNALTNKSNFSIYQNVIFTLSQLCIFLTSLCPKNLANSTLKPIMETPEYQIASMDIRSSREFGSLLRILFKLFCGSEFEEEFAHTFMNWLSETAHSENTTTFLGVLAQFAKPSTKIQIANCQQIISRLRAGLLAKSSMERKESLFVLQWLTCEMSKNSAKPEPHQNIILNNIFWLHEEGVRKFWADFFDFYEILDEKQIHIIKPLLPKLQTFKAFCSSGELSKFQWYFVILSRMIHHDNRHIAREGVVNWLEAGINFVPGNPILKKLFSDFLCETVLPILKESVGWIFPDAGAFFDNAKKLGVCLTQIFDNSFTLMLDSVMSFMNKFDVGLSPPAVFFFALSLNYGILDVKNPVSDGIAFVEDLSLITRFLQKGISALDKFLRLQTQKLFVAIFCKLEKCVATEYFDFTSKAALEIVSFLGSLDMFVICSTNSLSDFQERLRSQEIRLSHLSSFSSRQVLGVYRLAFLSKSSVRPAPNEEFLNPDMRNSFIQARVDFLDCHLHSKNLSEFFVQEMRQALHFWKSESDFIERDKFSLKFHPNFHLNQAVLHQIAAFSAISDTKNDLLGIISHASHVLDSQFNRLGENIQNDFELLAFCGVIARFLNSHTESNIIEFPASIALYTFSNLFDRTISSNYRVCSDSFRADFIATRMSALSSVLQVNQKIQNARNMKTDNSALPLYVINASILNSIIDEMDLVGPQGITCVLEFLGACLPHIDPKDVKLREMVDGLLIPVWERVFEMRKTEAFWDGVRLFVQNVLVHTYFSGRGVLEKFAREIFDKSDTVIGISVIFMEAVCNAVATVEPHAVARKREFLNICLEALCFGPPLLKHIKVLYGLWEYIQSKNSSPMLGLDPVLNAFRCGADTKEDCYDFVFSANARTRVLGIHSIVNLLQTESHHEQSLGFIVQYLLDKNDFESDKKKRYFGNSSTHRIKQRIAQTLLVLQPMFTKDLSEIVTRRLVLSLTRDSPQPSARYLMEWIIVRCLTRFSELHSMFFNLAQECYKKRVGFGSFIATICMHLCLNLEDCKTLVDCTDQSLRFLSSLVMGQHFTVRLYARVCFRRVYENAVSNLSLRENVLDKFEIIYENVRANHPQPVGNVSKILKNIDKDFYTEIFNAQTHYKYEVIFIYLPRMADMASDELIQEKHLIEIFKRAPHVPSVLKPGFDCDSKIKLLYSENEEFAWHLKAISDDGREMGEEMTGQVIDDSSESSNFQKKINPWKFLSVAPEISDFSEKLQLRKNSDEGLVVVASLIDRAPNLGGLCRSCEIFGVSRYVIAGLKSMEEQQFKNLSVSAQSWIDILEVPVRDLDTFLTLQSSKGYTILGVEQALESIPLNEYKFPKKSVLLLGNEKFGIPPHLLDKVDQCLEIPQVGVVRSLNVHVTGAICIWQYAMQHN